MFCQHVRILQDDSARTVGDGYGWGMEPRAAFRKLPTILPHVEGRCEQHRGDFW